MHSSRGERSLTERLEARAPEKGAVIVELALILPLILLVILAGMELSMLMKTYERLSVISREATNSVFRECSVRIQKDLDDSKTPIQIRDTVRLCLQEQVPDAWRFGHDMVSGLAVVVNVYRFDGAANLAMHDGACTISSSAAVCVPVSPDPKFQSHYGLTPPPAVKLARKTNIAQAVPLHADNRLVVIGEVYYKPAGLTHYLFSVLRTVPEVLYEATIF